jgi:hypothetical protein
LDLYEDQIDKAEDAHAFSSSPYSRVKGSHRTSWHAVPLLKNSGYEEFDHPIRPTFRKLGPVDYFQGLSSTLRLMQRNTRTVAGTCKAPKLPPPRQNPEIHRFCTDDNYFNAISPAVSEPDIVEIST